MTAQELQFRVDGALYPFLLSVLQMERGGVIVPVRGDIYYQSRNRRTEESRRLLLTLATPHIVVSKGFHPVTVVRLEDGVQLQVLDNNPVVLWWESEVGSKPKKVEAFSHTIKQKLKIGKRYRTQADDPANLTLKLPTENIFIRFEDFWEAKVIRP